MRRENGSGEKRLATVGGINGSESGIFSTVRGKYAAVGGFEFRIFI